MPLTVTVDVPPRDHEILAGVDLPLLEGRPCCSLCSVSAARYSLVLPGLMPSDAHSTPG